MILVQTLGTGCAACDKLAANVDASRGSMDVAALDLKGNTLATSEHVAGDWPCAPVRWQTGSLAGLEQRPIQLRFTLRNAKLYSFRLAE